MPVPPDTPWARMLALRPRAVNPGRFGLRAFLLGHEESRKFRKISRFEARYFCFLSFLLSSFSFSRIREIRSIRGFNCRLWHLAPGPGGCTVPLMSTPFACRGNKAEIEEGAAFAPKFDADGLIPAMAI